MKFTYVVFGVLIGLSFQNHAHANGKAMNRACRIMFGVDIPKTVASAEKLRSEIQPFAQRKFAELDYFYTRLSSAKLKVDANWALSHIADTNNDILDAAAYLRSEKFRFSTRAEKINYDKLMDILKSMLQKQGFPPSFIEMAFEKRYQVVESMKKEDAEPIRKRPIGYVISESDKRSEKPISNRTIGFMRTPVETVPYGNVSEKSSEKESSTAARTSIGFIKTQADDKEKPTRRLPSIGFVQPEAPVDVGYQVSLSFNLSTGQFEIKSGQNQIGFLVEK